MYRRSSKPLISNSFFAFGARGTGKSTLVRKLLSGHSTLTIDLLNPDEEERFGRHPETLRAAAMAQTASLEWIFIDEVQKSPKLLDVVHSLMETPETKHLRFALTGSSARKLKIVGANLLAGRAFVNELLPLTHTELAKDFDLGFALNWGTLPMVAALPDDLSRQEFLRTSARTYIKEEIWDERLVQNLDPFRKFIELAAQTNGTILNYSNIARDVGVDDKTVKKYFEILADTFLGFYLEGFHRSVRKQQVKSRKFYLFDTGVKRAMEGMLTVGVVPGTYAFGKAFEHFVLCECIRLNSYGRRDYRFFYLRTKDNLEIDLIIERPGARTVVVEIKSSSKVDDRDASAIQNFKSDFADAEFYIWSLDPLPQVFDGVRAVPWQMGLSEVGLG